MLVRVKFQGVLIGSTFEVKVEVTLVATVSESAAAVLVTGITAAYSCCLFAENKWVFGVHPVLDLKGQLHT
jgi:hypothetical protein